MGLFGDCDICGGFYVGNGPLCVVHEIVRSFWCDPKVTAGVEPTFVSGLRGSGGEE